MRRATALIGAVSLALAMLVATPAHAAAPTVTLKATATPVGADGEEEIGQVGVSGVAKGVDQDDPVSIEYRKANGRWGRVGLAVVEAQGAFEARFRSPRAGATQLRARVVVDGRSRVSKTVTVRLAKLFDLTAQNAASLRAANDFTTQDSFKSRTVVLSNRSGKGAFATWELQGRCSAFFGAAGVLKTTTPGSGPVSISVTTWVKGAAQVRLVNLSRTDRVQLTDESIGKVTRLRVATVFAQDDRDPREIVTPAVLCTATPSLDGL